MFPMKKNVIFYSYVNHYQREYATTHVILLVEHQLVRGNLTAFPAHSAETTPLVRALWPGEAQNLVSSHGLRLNI